MKRNIGSADRDIRALSGLALLALFFFLEGNARWIALAGAVPLVTAILGWCPLYLPFKFSTCARDERARNYETKGVQP